MRGNSGLVRKRELVIGPTLEKPLLKLHRTMDVKSFWKAVHRLLSASIAYHSVGLLLQQNPSAPVIAKWTRLMPDDFFAAKALKRCAMQRPRKKLLRFDRFFPHSHQLLKIRLLSPLHGAAKMRLRRHASLLEKAETHLHHSNSARGEARRFFNGGDEIASATLPAISGRTSRGRIAGARAMRASGF